VKFSAQQACRLTVPFGVTLLWPNDAQAQKIPIEAVWSAGAGLFAPFIAIPIKIALARFSKVNAANFHPWSLSLIEWVIWFPAAYVLLRSSDANLIPVVLPALLGLSIWLHRSWANDASWPSAILLSLPTPILAVALPLLIFVGLSSLAV
jgi:hypothetical protein